MCIRDSFSGDGGAARGGAIQADAGTLIINTRCSVVKVLRPRPPPCTADPSASPRVCGCSQRESMLAGQERFELPLHGLEPCVLPFALLAYWLPAEDLNLAYLIQSQASYH